MELKKKQDGVLHSLTDKCVRLLRAMAREIQPRDIDDFNVWCDTKLVIPSEASSQAGQWQTSTFPFWKTPMQLLTPHKHCRELTFMKGCQVAATTVMIAHTMYIADQYPSPYMLCQPTKDAANDFSTQKWEPFVKGNPISHNTLGEGKPKGYTNTTLTKTYPGGFLTMGGINNVNFIKSKSIRYLALDEEDSYDISSKDDGNNIEVVRKRTNNYPDSVIIRGTTPKIAETSTNYDAFKQGSQERYYVPCLHCNPNADINGTYFYLHHEGFKFRGEIVDDMPEEVYFECTHCGEEIHESAKPWMMHYDRAFWLSEKGNDDGDRPYFVDEKTEKRSFHLPSYYSPIGFLSWREAFSDYFKYQRTKDIEDLRVYRNQIEGLPISLAGDDQVNRTELQKRANESSYGDKQVQIPTDGLMLTMGVDIQGDWIAYEVMATGLEGQTWSVDYGILKGVTSSLGNTKGLDENGNPTAWRKLADLITRKTYRHQSGCNMPIEYTFVDAGFRADVVHQFCYAHERYQVYPCIGRTGWDEGKVVAPKRRHQKYKTKLFIVKKDPMILELYEKLNVPNPGARYCHFPKLPQYNGHYFKGLTSEKQIVKQRNGQRTLGWEKIYERNEPIDVRCYAWAAQLAAQEHLSIRANREYPLPANRLTFWKDPNEVKLRRQVDDPRGEPQYMQRKKRKRSNKLVGKTLGRGVAK